MIIETTDSTYSYTIVNDNTKYAVPVHKLINNKKSSNTLGFQIKTQVGKNRIETVIDLLDSDSNIRNSLLPMLEYPVNVNVTFDENLPLRNTATITMNIVDYDIDSKIQDMDDGDLRMKLKLVEVVGV